MLNKILKYILFLCLGVSAGACGDDIDTSIKDPLPDSPGSITLRFRNSDNTRSAESDNSETLIENLYIAFFPATADENARAVTVRTFTGLTDHTRSTVTTILTEELITQLFGNVNGASCRMYVLANTPESSMTALGETPTIKEMKDLEVTAPFKTAKVQPSFVMSGEGTVTYTAGVTANDPGTAKGNADLFRAAAKIRLNLSIPASITVKNADGEDEVWEPETTGIRCLITNGVMKSTACPVSTEETPWKPEQTDAYYDIELGDEPSCVRNFSNTGSGTYPYIMDVPFYTYPNAWEESISEEHKTTMTLMVAWRLRGNTTWHTYYYQVPVTSTELPHIDRNYYYNVNLTVGMLGSLVPETPIELDPLSYQVVNWSNEQVNVNINDFRYLVVNPNVVTVNNEADIEIPFYSSHPVDLSDITMTFQRFNYYSNGNGDVVDIEVNKNIIDASTWTHDVTENGTTRQVTDTICNYSIVKDPTTNQYSVRLEHAMDIWTPSNGETFTNHSGSGTVTITAQSLGITRFQRPTTPETPYSAYVFKITIQHKDNSSYKQDIYITQYPGMYIEAKRNPSSSTTGNVFVNTYSNANGGLGNVNGIQNSSANKNPNMYIINISQLDNTSEFIIGDPRMQYTKNNLDGSTALTTSTADDISAAGDWCNYVNTANVLYKKLIDGTDMSTTGNNRRRRLSFYYPTIESNEDPYKMRIAPKLRIASSWGQVNTINRQTARRRAATYQEQECPAGRWRLPTYGELLFIINLSENKKIPRLFNQNGTYWTAQGAYTVQSDGTLSASNSTNAFIRAVYDEWYWEQFPQYTISPTNGNYTYTLGDMPRGKQ